MLTIPTEDGFPLAAHAYVPDDGRAPRAVVVIQAGTAIPQKFYRRFAEHLAEDGLAVVTFDYRGIGESAPEKLASLDANMVDWAQKDCRAALAFARRRFVGLPLFVVGHSFGAQSIGLLDELGEVDAFVSVAGQFGWYGHWSLATRLELGALWHLAVPVATRALGYFPGKIGLGGVDLPAGVAQQWARWCTSRDYYKDHVPGARARLGRFDRPTLMWSFTDDELAPHAAVKALERSLPLAPMTHVRLSPEDLAFEGIEVDAVGHFGFFKAPMWPLWDRVTWFFDSVIAGRFVGSRSSYVPTEDDVMADLVYGRA